MLSPTCDATSEISEKESFLSMSFNTSSYMHLTLSFTLTNTFFVSTFYSITHTFPSITSFILPHSCTCSPVCSSLTAVRTWLIYPHSKHFGVREPAHSCRGQTPFHHYVAKKINKIYIYMLKKCNYVRGKKHSKVCC